MGDLPLFPTFSTSPSAASRRKSCARMHYLSTYESWGGWYTREEFERRYPERDYAKSRKAYMLKNAKSRWSLLGTAVHRFAERYLKAERLGLTFDGLAARRHIAGELHQVVADTTEEKWRQDPKRSPAIFEILYGQRTADSFLALVLDGLPGLLDELERSDALAAARAAISARRRIDVERRLSFRIGPATVWSIPDLAYDDEEGREVIVDWKTGRRREEHRDQVGTYALAASVVRPGVAVRMRLVYLDDPYDGDDIVDATPEHVETARASILAEAEACRELVVDGDLERNEPLPIEAFPMLPEGSEKCRRCDFRRMCGRG